MVDVLGRAVIKVRGEVDGASFDRDGATIGQRLSAGLNRQLIRGAKIAGAAAGVAAGAAVVGGFKRLVTLQNTQIAFEAMGKSASQVASIMDIVKKSVEGTAFSLDEAASASKTFVAAGIGGDKLAQTLQDIGDVAAFTGASFGEVGTIVAQVVNKGKVQTEELLQLAERGLPIFPLLQRETGLSGAQLSEALQGGKVSVDQFLGALQKAPNIAKQANRTVAGSFANMRTAVSRATAKAIAPVFEKLPDLFNKISEAVDGINPSFDKFVSVAKTLAAPMAVLITALIAARIHTLALNLALRANPFGVVVTVLAVLALGFRSAWENSEVFRGVVAKTFEAITAVVRVALLAFEGLFRALSHVPGFGWAKGVADGIQFVRDKLADLSDKVDKHAQTYDKVKKHAVDAFAEIARLEVLQLLPQKLAAGFAKLPKSVQIEFATNFPQTSEDIARIASTIKGVSDTKIQLLIDAAKVKTTVADVRKNITALREDATGIELKARTDQIDKVLKEVGVKVSNEKLVAIVNGDVRPFVEVFEVTVSEAGKRIVKPKLDLDKTTAQTIIDKFIKDSNARTAKPKLDLDTNPARAALEALLASSVVTSLGNIFNPDHKATGGISAGGWTVVGEKGPELVNLPAGSEVFTNTQSKQMVSTPAAGDFTYVQNFYGAQSLSAAQKDMEWARRYGTRFGAANRSVGV